MKKDTPWWKKSVVYQIYPKSFQDSTGSGTGDLIGITKRLEYIKLLGVDAIWLTPFYVSPQVDHGYDVSDYLNVDPMYGNLLDFDNLVKKAHKLDLKIIIDMVFNHSSTQHPWFKKSLNYTSPYRSYYIWRNPSEKGGPPNNWKSKFGGQAWSWHKESSQYYMHLWSTEQADLNWENKKLRNELKKIVHFWAKKGIDGLRLDVINLVSKPQDFSNDPNGDGLRLYTDGPKIHQYIREMSKDVFHPLKLMTVGEMSSATLKNCIKYSSLKGNALSMVFSFDHVEVDFFNGNKWTLTPLNLISLKSIFSYWQKGMYNKAWNALFWCNHDQPRIVSRWGNDTKYRIPSAKLFAIVLHGMQGTPYIYQGEEIGMTNPKFNCILDYKDIETLNLYKKYRKNGIKKIDILKILAKKSRDNGRTPMQWDAKSKNGGFSEGIPWIKMNDNFNSINVKDALFDKQSIFYTYQKLIFLRKKYDVITWGNYKDLLPEHPFLWCYLRIMKKEKLLVVANFSNKKQNFFLKELNNNHWKLLINSYNDKYINITQNIKLRPYEAIWWYKS